MKFEEVAEAFRNGAKIKRPDYDPFIYIPGDSITLTLELLMADDWEIVKEAPIEPKRYNYLETMEQSLMLLESGQLGLVARIKELTHIINSFHKFEEKALIERIQYLEYQLLTNFENRIEALENRFNEL